MSTIAAPPLQQATRSSEPQFWQIALLRGGFILLLLAIWELVCGLGKVPSYLLPPPVGFSFGPGGFQIGDDSIFRAFQKIIGNGQLRDGLLASFGRMAMGYGTSVVGGITLGILVARNWYLKQTIGSLIMALQSLPSICWLPFALIWVGLNEKAILVVIILGALFSIAISTEGAIRNVPPIYTKVGRVLGAKRFALSRDILFFAALPELLGGLKVGWTFAWRSLMAAELIRADVAGIGSLLQVGRDFNDMSLMFATVFTILAVGLTVDTLIFGTLERKVRRRYGLEK